MTEAPLPTRLARVRCLAVAKQRLTGRPPPRATSEAIRSVLRDLAFVQWDPISIVAPSHLLTVWSRIPAFRPPDLERLLWEERSVFEHWTPLASIVLAEDYPLYASLMRRYPDSLSDSWRSQRLRAKAFLRRHRPLRARMLAQLRRGPLRLGDFEDHARTKRSAVDWAPTSDVALMLFHLSMSGEAMVVGHDGPQNVWGRPSTFLPKGTDRARWSAERTDREAAVRAVRALGTATPTEINYHFVRGRYTDLRGTLASLVDEGVLHRVAVEGWGSRDERYVHDLDRPFLDEGASTSEAPRMALLPPFDNLLQNTARTERLFGFRYIREQFLPPEKRTYGTYVLPILWGDRLIGRLDPRFDKERRILAIQAVHAEPDAPSDREVGETLSETVAALAEFLGARGVTYPARVPAGWSRALRG